MLESKRKKNKGNLDFKVEYWFKSKGTLMTFKTTHFNYRDKKKSFQKNFQIKGTEFLPQT